MRKIILSALCAMAIMSCSTQKSAMDITGKWNIEKAMGKSTVGADTSPFISFDKEGNINGNASVNSFFGSYNLNGDKISFSNLGMTRMMGQSMDIEQAITEALGSTSTIKAEDFDAVFFNEKKDTVMILRKQK